MLCCEDGCPSALFRIFTAAFRSAWSAWPHVVQVNSRPHPGRDFGSTAPHAEQRCDVYGAGTTRISDPNFRALYPSCRRRSPAVLSRIERFSPAFWRMFVPGVSTVPRAVRVSSRRMRQEFPELSARYWRRSKLWSGSYFAGSVGGAPLSIVKQYIEQQNRPT